MSKDGCSGVLALVVLLFLIVVLQIQHETKLQNEKILSSWLSVVLYRMIERYTHPFSFP